MWARITTMPLAKSYSSLSNSGPAEPEKQEGQLSPPLKFGRYFNEITFWYCCPPLLKNFWPSTVSETDLSIDSSQGPLWLQQKRLTKGYHAYLFFLATHSNILYYCVRLHYTYSTATILFFIFLELWNFKTPRFCSFRFKNGV